MFGALSSLMFHAKRVHAWVPFTRQIQNQTLQVVRSNMRYCSDLVTTNLEQELTLMMFERGPTREPVWRYVE